jgi:hypothetical protein
MPYLPVSHPTSPTRASAARRLQKETRVTPCHVHTPSASWVDSRRRTHPSGTVLPSTSQRRHRTPMRAPNVSLGAENSPCVLFGPAAQSPRAGCASEDMPPGHSALPCPVLSCPVLPCPAPSGEKRDVTLCRQRRAAAAFCDCGVEWFTRIPFSTLISRVLDLPKAGLAGAAQRCLLLVALCTVPTRGLHCAVGRCVRSGTAKLKPCPSPTCPRADLPHIHPHHTRTQAHLAHPIPSCPPALPASRRARIGHTPDHHLPMPLPCLALPLMPARPRPRPRPSTHPGIKENVPIQRCWLDADSLVCTHTGTLTKTSLRPTQDGCMDWDAC